MKEKSAKLIVLFAVVISSPASIFSRMILGPTMVTSMYRMAITSLVLLPVVLWKHREELRTVRLRSLVLCLLSGACLGMHFTTYFTAIRYTSIASSTALVDTEVLFVALVLLLVFHEKIPKAGVLGIALAFAGSLIIACGDNSGGSNIVYGDFMALAAAIFSAGYTLIGRGQRKMISTVLYTFFVYASACITLLGLILITGQPMSGYSASDFGFIIAMVVCCTLLGHSVFSWGLKYVSAAYISTAKLGEPVFATIMGVLLFSELPRVNQFFGGVIVLGGIILFLLTKDKTAQTESEKLCREGEMDATLQK